MLRFLSDEADAEPLEIVAETDDPDHPSAMQVIVVSSQKGGSGKTTLCGHLAVQAELAGNGPVAIIDTDPQGSLAQWWNARSNETPVFMKASVDYLHEDLYQLERSGIRTVFIDTPPAVTDTIRRIVAFADMVVIPTRPSPHDLRAVGATLDIVESHRKPLIFAVNAAAPRARITIDTAIALSQHGTVAPTAICHRTTFATSMIHGQTVMETNPGSLAAEEIADLWSYVNDRLARSDGHVTRGTGVYQEKRGIGFGRRRTAPAPTVLG